MAAVAVAVIAGDDAGHRRASTLAQQLALPLLVTTDPSEFGLELFYDGDRLTLRPSGRRAGRAVTVDLAASIRRLASVSRSGEMLARAVGARGGIHPAVLDATAGLGRDGAVLAALGLEVVLTEREPVIAALLADGLRRARDDADPRLAALAGRMQLVSADACRLAVGATLPAVDVITLDPMFPERSKSAAVKKEMQLLQQLLGAEPEPAGLLDWALAQPVARVVVKRPARAPSVAGPAPSHTIAGRRVRYDVYVRRSLTRPA